MNASAGKSRALHTIAATFSAVSAIVIAAGYTFHYASHVEPQRFHISQETIKTDSMRREHAGMRIVVASDMHIGSFSMDEKRVERIVDLINALDPDLVLMPGDFFNAYEDWKATSDFTHEGVANQLSRITAPKLAVLGNHEYKHPVMRAQDYERILEQHGIPVLNNEAFEIETRKGRVWVAGIDDISRGAPDYNAAFRDIPEKGETIFYMTHNPDGFLNIDRPIALAVAGDTHCGQINIFGVRPVTYLESHMKTIKRWNCGPYDDLPAEPVDPSMNKNSDPFYARDGSNHGLVSGGIGTSNQPIRIGAMPEINLVTLDYQTPQQHHTQSPKSPQGPQEP